MFFLQVVLGIAILTFEFRRRRAQIVDVMAIFNFIFFICYVVAPVAGYYMLPNWQDYSVMRYTIVGADYESSFFYFTGLLILLAYLILIFSYWIFHPHFKNRFFNTIFLKPVSQIFLFRYAVVLFVISFVAIMISSFSFGGLVNWVIANPRLYFTDEAHEVQSASWGLDKASNLMVFSGYLFWGLYMNDRKLRNTIGSSLQSVRQPLFLFLALSLLLSSAVVIHSGGRLVLFRFLATFFIASMYLTRNRLSYIKLLVLGVLGALTALYGRLVFKYFIYKDFVQETVNEIDDSLLDQFFGFINNYTFAFYSANHNLKYGIDNFKLFGDMFTWPFQFLPPSVRPENLPYTTKLNTFRLMNLKDTGIVPSDIVSYGIINGHVFGVIIVSCLFGIFLKFLNSYSFRINNYVSAVLYVSLAFVIGFRVMYFDPAHLFKGSFDVIIGLIGISFLSRVKNK